MSHRQTGVTRLRIDVLEDRTTPNAFGVRVAAGDVNGDGFADIAVGMGAGGPPVVRTYSGKDGLSFNPFTAAPETGGGASVAVATATIGRTGYVIAGGGNQGLIGAYAEAVPVIADFYVPYRQDPIAGVSVATADFTGDGVPDILVGAGFGGGPRVTLFDGLSNQILRDFFAYDPNFRGGVQVAAGDITGDGVPDILTGAGAGGGPHVRVFDWRSLALKRDFLAYDTRFRGGVNVAAADLTGDGQAEMIVGAGPGGGAHVRVYNSDTDLILRDFFAYAEPFRGGVNVAAADLNRDGVADIVTAPAFGGGPHVRAFSGANLSQLASFFAFDPEVTGGAFSVFGAPVTVPPAPVRPPVPAVIPTRFDFNGQGDLQASTPGFTPVQPTETFDQGLGYGWVTPVLPFERGSSSSADFGLTADGAYGVGNTGTFRVNVPARSAVNVRAYLGDQFSAWPNIRVDVEGNANPPTRVSTRQDQYTTIELLGADVDGDGAVNITVSSSGIWVINGLDVTTGALPASALPAPVLRTPPTRFDFDGPSGLRAATSEFVGVQATELYDDVLGYGWAAQPRAFERTISTSADSGLTIDGAWGVGGGSTFRVRVAAGAAVNARAYLGDQFSAWSNMTVQIEGRTDVPVRVSTLKDEYKFVELTGSDANRDGIIDVTIGGTSIWVVNGVDVTTGTLPRSAI